AQVGTAERVGTYVETRALGGAVVSTEVGVVVVGGFGGLHVGELVTTRLPGRPVGWGAVPVVVAGHVDAVDVVAGGEPGDQAQCLVGRTRRRTRRPARARIAIVFGRRPAGVGRLVGRQRSRSYWFGEGDQGDQGGRRWSDDREHPEHFHP